MIKYHLFDAWPAPTPNAGTAWTIRKTCNQTTGDREAEFGGHAEPKADLPFDSRDICLDLTINTWGRDENCVGSMPLHDVRSAT